jgi:hypothetical protein
MSTLNEIVHRITSNVNGGNTTDEMRFDSLYIESKIHTARASILSATSRQPMFDRINEACVQAYSVEILENLVDQDCDVVRFPCPTVIRLDDRHDGFVYVGHVNQQKPFIRIRSNYTALSMHSLFQKEKEVVWDYQADYDGKFYILLYKNPKQTKLLIKAFFNDPTEVPNYRKDVDQYPVDATLENDIVNAVTNDLLRQMVRTADVISDSLDTVPNKPN